MPWSDRAPRSQTLPPDWQKTRRRILGRDPHCTLAYPGICTDTATEVDHIADPDDHDDDNLRGVCNPCHKQRTQAQAQAGLRRYHATRQRTRPPEQHPGLLP